MKTISFGDGLLAELHGTILPYLSIAEGKTTTFISFISPNISPISMRIKLGMSLYHVPTNYCVALLLD